MVEAGEDRKISCHEGGKRLSFIFRDEAAFFRNRGKSARQSPLSCSLPTTYPWHPIGPGSMLHKEQHAMHRKRRGGSAREAA